MELASGKTASQKRIGLYDVPVTSEPLRYLNPINNNGKYSFIPYLTEKWSVYSLWEPAAIGG
ncbi:hypothetical protein GCM10020331_024140 [Ectobacillus funiculus]